MSGLISVPQESVPPVPRLSPTACAQLPDGALRLAVTPTGEGPHGTFAVVCAGGPVVCFAGPDLTVSAIYDDHRGGTCAAAYSPDGRVLVTGGHDGAYVLRGNDETRRSEPTTTWVEQVAFSRDGKRFAVSRGKTVLVVDAVSFAVCAIHAVPSTPSALYFFDGILAAACYGGVLVWAKDGTGAQRTYAWRSALLSLVQSPDTKHFATGCQDAAVHCWKRSSGDDFHMSGYPSKVKALAFSPDSRFLATGGSTAVTVWDFAAAGPQGSTPRELRGHAGLVTALVFSSPRRLWSGGHDGSVIGWDLDLRRGSGPVAVHVSETPVVDVAVVGGHVLAVHSGGTIVSCEVKS
jgi:WD40 repeat protein